MRIQGMSMVIWYSLNFHISSFLKTAQKIE
jgi:hypothetical protein